MTGTRVPRSHPYIQRRVKARKSAKNDWHFDHVVANATEEKMNRIWDAFIDAVEKEGLYCAGSFHAAGGCNACKNES